MSLVEELGGRVRTAAEELPVERLGAAVVRLHRASDALRWAHHAATAPTGLHRLGTAIEHAEHAAAALRAARDALDGYVGTVLGLATTTTPAPGPAPPPVPRPPPQPLPGGDRPAGPGWWPARVDRLAGRGPEPADGNGPCDADGPQDADELLRRVVCCVGAADPDGLWRVLRAADASAGLRLAGLAAPVTARCTRRIVGHPPGPDDLVPLRDTARPAVRRLLPGLPEAVLDPLLARSCRVRAPAGGHPVDTAVGAAVLAAVLLVHQGPA